MASKLRRAPLFGIDNPLRIPTLPKYTSNGGTPSSYKCVPKANGKLHTTIPAKCSTSEQTKCSLKTSQNSLLSQQKEQIKIGKEQIKSGTSAATQLKVNANNRTSKKTMEVGVAYTNTQRGGRMGGSDTGRGSPKTSLHVDFQAPGEMKERKEKYLTAKYGAHQMALIRKRLGVEMWMFDQLQILYQPKNEGSSEEKEVDLDELLDLEDDLKRRQFLKSHLADCPHSQDKVNKFIDELLERAKIL